MDVLKEKEEKDQIEKIKLKRLIKKLDSVKGAGTSVVTLLLPPGTQIHKVSQMLTEEIGTASNIKSRVNRNGVLGAISSAQIRLNNFNTCPKNGFVLFAGEVSDDCGKVKKVVIDFEPYKELTTTLYRCDDKFHTDALKDMLTDDSSFGFIIIDGEGLLLATVCGDTKVINFKYSVDLPKKHNKGGQSAQRFGRINQEMRHNYITKVCEYITQTFITDSKPNVKGLIIAGNAEFKQKLYTSSSFDQRLHGIVLKVLDSSYGGENGLNETIKKSIPVLDNAKMVQEIVILQKFYEEINIDGKYVFGIEQIIECLEAGVLQDLIIWKDFEGKKGDDSFVDWILENIQRFGATLHLVSDRTTEGSQFITGFGGVGGILRYKIELIQSDVIPVNIDVNDNDKKKTFQEEEYDFM